VVNNAIAKITGELSTSPLVQINQTAVIAGHPDVLALQARLVRALARHPGARADVLAVFEEFQGAATVPQLPPPAVIPTAPPAIEGHVVEAAP
jgi:hypothetical protein